MDNPILVEVTRGGIVESRHRGALAVVDSEGSLVFSIGEIDTPIFPRSAVKALQALPLVESGIADKLKLSDAELALACSSHSGEEDHVATAASALAKAGRDVTCLECGAHWPLFDKAARGLAASGGTPSALHNNCSGKHAGFVCLAIGMGEDPKGYIGHDHKVMRKVSAALSETTGFDLSRAARGIDGCSIPTYAIPLRHLAHGFAKFGSGRHLGGDRAQAAAKLRAAVAANPRMIGGTERFDTVMTEVFKSRVFMKGGAEGVHCAALPELGFGIAVKMDDGAGRAADTVMAAAINRYLPFMPAEKEAVWPRLDWPMTNWNGFEVGHLRATETLLAGTPGRA